MFPSCSHHDVFLGARRLELNFSLSVLEMPPLCHYEMQLSRQALNCCIPGLVGKGMTCITCLVKWYRCYIPLKDLVCNSKALDSFLSNGELFLKQNYVCCFQLCHSELFFTICRHFRKSESQQCINQIYIPEASLVVIIQNSPL